MCSIWFGADYFCSDWKSTRCSKRTIVCLLHLWKRCKAVWNVSIKNYLLSIHSLLLTFNTKPAADKLHITLISWCGMKRNCIWLICALAGIELAHSGNTVFLHGMLWCAGYLLLTGRVRQSAEEREIISVLESVFRHKVDPFAMFSISAVNSSSVASDCRRPAAPPLTRPLLCQITSARLSGFDGIVWTYNMRRMALLIEQALRFAEPVLLVGETGYAGVISACFFSLMFLSM